MLISVLRFQLYSLRPLSMSKARFGRNALMDNLYVGKMKSVNESSGCHVQDVESLAFYFHANLINKMVMSNTLVLCFCIYCLTTEDGWGDFSWPCVSMGVIALIWKLLGNVHSRTVHVTDHLAWQYFRDGGGLFHSSNMHVHTRAWKHRTAIQGR